MYGGTSAVRDVKRVSVVGAGIAGLVAALAVARNGVRVTVVDRAQARKPYGGFVNVSPNMLRDLVSLGVGDECTRRGFAYNGVDLVGSHGDAIIVLDKKRLAGLRYPAALGIEYEQLRLVLIEAAVSCGVAFRWGAEVSAVERTESHTSLRLESGDLLVSDLIVFAGGATSGLRIGAFQHATPVEHTNRLMTYVQAPRPVGLNRAAIVGGSDGRRALIVPVAASVAGLAFSERLQQDGSRGVSARLHMQTSLVAFPEMVRSIARQVGESTYVTSMPIFSGLLPQPWNLANVLAIGDAAHAMPPQLDQSTALAIEDGVVLGSLLQQTRDCLALLSAFVDRRRTRVERVYHMVCKGARWESEPETETDFAALMMELDDVVSQPP